jgi:hypothetical protein
MIFTFDLTAMPFSVLVNISQPIVKTAFFHIISVNPRFIASSNSFQKVFILASTIQKFLIDGSVAVSLILCQKSWDKL